MSVIFVARLYNNASVSAIVSSSNTTSASESFQLTVDKKYNKLLELQFLSIITTYCNHHKISKLNMPTNERRKSLNNARVFVLVK